MKACMRRVKARMRIIKTKFVMVVTSSGKEGSQDHGVGAGASTVFIFDMSS